MAHAVRGTCRPGRSTSPPAQPLPYPSATQNARIQRNECQCVDRQSPLLHTWHRRIVGRYAARRDVGLPRADNREDPKNAKTGAKKSLYRPASTPRRTRINVDPHPVCVIQRHGCKIESRPLRTIPFAFFLRIFIPQAEIAEAASVSSSQKWRARKNSHGN